MAKYLDLTGLSHYDQKIKQYISQHSGGGALYKHNITVSNAGGDGEILNITLINSISSAYTSSNDLTSIIDSHEVVGFICNDTNLGYKIIGFIYNNKVFGWQNTGNNNYFIDYDLIDYSIVSDYVISL